MKLLLKFAKKYTWPLVITILSMLVLVGAQLLIPWLMNFDEVTIFLVGAKPLDDQRTEY